MPFKPAEMIGEVLGLATPEKFDLADGDCICPFIQRVCTKRSTNLGKTAPYPVCSIWKNSRGERKPESDLICVCPKRFYAVDFLKDVIKHCWTGDLPTNPLIAPEVKMKGFGNVDFVIADVGADNNIKQFLSVELQAVDITGTVFPAYKSLCEGCELPTKPTYNFNWDNVYKRYVTQLIRKGYFHHHWKTKIVAVIQEQVYNYIVERADFMRSTNVKDQNVNIIFMTYRLESDPSRSGQFFPVLATVEGTSHSNLQAAILYKDAPSRDEFCMQIKKSLSR